MASSYPRLRMAIVGEHESAGQRGLSRGRFAVLRPGQIGCNPLIDKALQHFL